MQSLGRNWEPLGQKWVYWGIWSGMVGYGRLSSNMLDHPYTKHKYTNVQLHKTNTQLHKYGLASRLWQYSCSPIHKYLEIFQNRTFLSFKMLFFSVSKSFLDFRFYICQKKTWRRYVLWSRMRAVQQYADPPIEMREREQSWMFLPFINPCSIVSQCDRMLRL